MGCGAGSHHEAGPARAAGIARCLSLAALAVTLAAGAGTWQAAAQEAGAEDASILLDPLEAQALWEQALSTRPLGRVTVEYTSPESGCTGYVTSVAYRLEMPRDVAMKLTVHCDGGCSGAECAKVEGCTPVGLECTAASCPDELCLPWCERTITTPDVLGRP